jgi:putative flippase GtrA
MVKKDLTLTIIIGAAVGLLIQPILSNIIHGHAELAAHSGVLRIGAFFGLLLFAPLALFIASLIGKYVPVIYQFAKFAAVGTLNSFIDLGIFNVETLALSDKPTGLLFAIMKSFSFLCGTTNSYFWNRKWTFRSASAPNPREALKFYGIAIAGFFVNVGVATYVFNAVTPPATLAGLWTSVVSPVCGIFAALILNFLGYKFFVFKSNR